MEVRRELGLCPCSVSKVEQEIDMIVADLGEGLGNVLALKAESVCACPSEMFISF